MNRKVVVLQLLDRTLYKTVGISIGQYLGDPINVLAHFSEFEANEVLIMDISSSPTPDFEFLRLLGKHCSMPLSYVGSVLKLEDIQKVVTLGFERVLIGDAAYENPAFLSQAVDCFGTSTIGIMVNYQINDGRRVIWRKNKPEYQVELTSEFLLDIACKSVGEIVLYCISSDGRRKGFDFGVLPLCPQSVNVNLCGGCTTIREIDESLEKFENVSFSAGSIFSLLPNNSVFLKYSKDM